MLIVLVQRKRVDEQNIRQISSHLFGEAFESVDFLLDFVQGEGENLELFHDFDGALEVSVVILREESGDVEEQMEG